MISLKHARSILIKITAFCLILAMTVPVTAFATEEVTVTPRASYYLDAYNTYICDMGSGKIQIWYEVAGTGDMDEIGTLSIRLYESSDGGSTWTWVKTFLHENYSSMLAYNDWYHYSYVSYQGVAGRTYKAYVCIWAGKDGAGDTRYMWSRM